MGTFVIQPSVNTTDDITVLRSEGSEGYAIQDARLSGDGQRLVLGLNSYIQPGDSTGGAMVQLKLVDFVDADGEVWTRRTEILTGGGFYGAVYKVAVSLDGNFFAGVVGDNGNYSVQVHHYNDENGLLQQLGDSLTVPELDRNANVELSGNGERLFVSTADQKVRVFFFTPMGFWKQMGSPMEHVDVVNELRPSFNGTVVALGSFHHAVHLYEETQNPELAYSPWEWRFIGDLDITKNSVNQKFAMSGDGRNAVVGESYSDGRNIARLFRRSGSVFAEVQDMLLAEGDLRGMVLSAGGERLVLAIEETVTAYQRDCSSGN